MWWLWLFPLIGAALLVGAVVMGVKTVEFLRIGRPGIAQVVDYSTHIDEGTTMYSPVLRLIDPPLGHERGTNSSSSDRKWRVGTKLRVKVDPMDATNFQIDSPDDAFLGPAILGVIGAVFLIMGLVFVFLFNGPRDEVIWEPDTDLPVEQLEPMARASGL